MVDITIAKVYAEALFLMALEKNKIEEYKKILTDVNDVFSKNMELRGVFNCAVISKQVKNNIISQIFKDTDQDIVNFLHVLVKKRREKTLPVIVKEYSSIIDDYNKVLKVQAYTPYKLTDEQKKNIITSLYKTSGTKPGKIEVEEVILPELIGGIVVKAGDVVIDGSLRNYLEQFREKATAVN
ncbi:MAG: ATP synthase F1 subunit delta [Armatimonadota bacterium]